MRNAQNPRIIVFLVIVMPIALAAKLYGQAKPLKAEVWDLKGSAIYSTAGESSRHLTVGTVLPAGTVVQTALGSAVDISLGKDGGTLRITENSILSLDRLTTTDTGRSNTIDVQLHVQAGSLLADVKRLSAASKYHVKVSNGIVGIRDGQFRINSQGFIVLLEGGLVMVHVPDVGDPVPHTLTAPPPVYFSPIEGIKPAPSPLIREVQNQIQARLRGP